MDMHKKWIIFVKKWGANAPQNLLHILKPVQELNHLLSRAEALVILIALVIALNQADAFSPLTSSLRPRARLLLSKAGR